jgi:hypothetical protein
MQLFFYIITVVYGGCEMKGERKRKCTGLASSTLRPASSDGISENIVKVVTATCSLLEGTLAAAYVFAVLLTT